MTSRDEQLAALRFALKGAEADVLRHAVEAGDQAKAIAKLQAERAATLDELDHSATKVRAIRRHLKRLRAEF